MQGFDSPVRGRIFGCFFSPTSLTVPETKSAKVRVGKVLSQGKAG